jgi:hypothetical protein
MKHAASISIRSRVGAVATAAMVGLLPAGAGAQVSPPLAASGTFTQTRAVSLEVRSAGPNDILETMAEGVASGTLSGTFVDSLTVVFLPNGQFSAQGTLTCMCTVDGKEGLLALVVTDTGEYVNGTPTFSGRGVIKGGTDELADLRGVLQFEGTVDLTTGLSTSTYSGEIHFHP